MKKIHIAVIGLAITAFTASISFAGNNTTILDQKCQIDTAIWPKYLESIATVASIAKNTHLVLQDLDKLAKKAPNPNLPIGKQLSLVDVDKFSSDSERLNAMNFTSLVESKYQRDLILIENLSEAANNYAQLQTIPDPKDSKYIYYEILFAFRQIFPDSHALTFAKNPAAEKCNIDFSLYKMQSEPKQKILNMTPAINDHVAWLDQMKIKYNMSPNGFDYKILNDAEKSKYFYFGKNFYQPLEVQKNYISDLENIRLFAKISFLVYQESLNDMLHSGGDENSIGASIEKKIKNKELSSTEIKMLKFWGVIDNKIPSEWVNMAKQFHPKNK